MDKSADESVIERNTINKKESNKIDFSQKPFSEDCEKYFLFNFRGITNVSSDLLTNIVKYQLSDYCDNNLLERTSFFRMIPSEQIMKWSNDLISKPLIKLKNNSLIKTAKQIFKRKIYHLIST